MLKHLDKLCDFREIAIGTQNPYLCLSAKLEKPIPNLEKLISTIN